jgi:DNA polymerase III subunit epsilon
MQLKLNRPLVVFDLETTGVNVGHDRIVEISMVKLFPDQHQETHTYRINPGIPIPAETTRIHGITDADVKNCPSFAQKAHDIFRFLDDCDLAGYNVLKFDFPLLVEEFLRANIDFDLKKRRIVDVQNIFHKMEQRTLSAAYKFYCGKDLINAHSAEADTLATLEILKAQIERYENTEYTDKEGKRSTPVINDIKALHEFSVVHPFADLVGHLIYNEKGEEVFNFGKNKGKIAADIFRSEPSYFSWMMNADFPESTKKIIMAIKMREVLGGAAKVK